MARSAKTLTASADLNETQPVVPRALPCSTCAATFVLFPTCAYMAREMQLSPKGEALWCKVLGEPAKGYDTEDRSWSCSLILDPQSEETIAFVAKLEDLFRELHGSTNKVARYGWPFGDETRKDENGREKQTGKIKVNFKRKEFTSRGIEKSPPCVVDSKKQAWPTEKLIGNGSTIRVAFTAWPWKGAKGNGMSLELERIQVIDLVSYDAPSVDPFDEEDGYVVPQVELDAAPVSVESQQGKSFSEKLMSRVAELEERDAEMPF